jgi:hypothetical protein
MQRSPWSIVALVAACLLLLVGAAEEHDPGHAEPVTSVHRTLTP